ncbi:MAG: hypothetical protein IJG09_08410 [Methanobrevibacter sp.]|nr:hypothetical protein [Methanobrevibacter sp.]MBQ7276180.1 hypothetical protein [Bacilli bacterium]
MKKTSYAQEERQFLKNLLIMAIIGLFIVVITNANYKKIQEEADHRIDAAVDEAYEAGYEVGFSEGYESVNPIHNVENWLADVEVANVIEEDGVDTIKLIDGNGDLWALCYDAE